MDTKALRQKILDLAIRGKLVPQDPNDEPASVLLERIRAEKQKMVKEGKLKAKDIKNDSVIYKGEDNLHYEKFADGTVKCIEDEIPFDIPDNWAWTRLGNVATIKGGKRIPKGYTCFAEKTRHAYIRVTNMKNQTILLNDIKYISDDVYEMIKSYTISKNDLYITIAGTIGVVGEVPTEMDEMNLTENAAKISCLEINKHFLLLILQTEFVQKQFKHKTYQVAMPKLGLERIESTLIPVCPLSESNSIYTRYSEILSVLKSIETDKADLEKIIIDAKSRILDLAIRGKLVPQDPNDEPASVLLERIKAEKEELIKQGKIKREKTESFIFKGEDNSYYEKLPDGWVLANFCTICELLSGRDLKKSEYSNAKVGIPYIIGASNFDNGNIIIERWTNNPQVISFKNDILLTCKGTVGELAFNTCGDVHIARQVMAIRNKTTILQEYLMLLMKYSVNNVKQKAKGLIPGISREDITSLQFRVPPLLEQERILKRTNNIINILENVEASLN